MTEKQTRPLKSLPVANYKSALARAVECLGDRYLLAKPINSVYLTTGRDRAQTRSRRIDANAKA